MVRDIERFVHPIVVLDTTPFYYGVNTDVRLHNGVPDRTNSRELYISLKRSFWRMRVGTYNDNMSVYVKLAIASRWDGSVYA